MADGDFVVNIPQRIESDWDDKYGPWLAGFPLNLLYTGLRVTDGGGQVFSSCYWFRSGYV